VVLTQILLERHPERMDLFPIALLHIMLRANDLALEFLRVFLRMSLATLENFQGSRTLSPFVSPFDWMRMFFPGPSPAPGPRKSIEPPEVIIKSPEATIELLTRQVAELEYRLRQLESESSSENGSSILTGPQRLQVRGPGDRPAK
jgi:hypothetical protein